MTHIPPPWGAGSNWKPSADDGRFPIGVSGNPAGRPVGAKSKRTLVAEALEARSDDVARAVIAKALDGDMQAAKLCLERVHPPKRPDGTRVKFQFDANASLPDQARAVLSAMAAGEVEVEVGQLFLGALRSLAQLLETHELAQRIDALEQAALAGATTQGLLGKVMERA